MAKAKKVEVPTVAVIEEFLEAWKEKARAYYLKQFEELKEQQKKEYDITVEGLKTIRKIFGERKYSDEQAAEIVAKYTAGELDSYTIQRFKSEIANGYLNQWKAERPISELSVLESMYDPTYLDKFLEREVDDKRRALISRVEKKAGKIVDAAGLTIGENGEINGVIVGELATVKVKTIYAGGYNIQCLHYRVLVR